MDLFQRQTQLLLCSCCFGNVVSFADSPRYRLLPLQLTTRALCKIRSGAGHLAGKPEVLPFSISGGTWPKMLSNHKKHKRHKSHNLCFCAFCGHSVQTFRCRILLQKSQLIDRIIGVNSCPFVVRRSPSWISLSGPSWIVPQVSWASTPPRIKGGLLAWVGDNRGPMSKSLFPHLLLAR